MTRSAEAGRTAVALMALAVLWLATRPFIGAVLDGQLYLIQAIAWADPRGFATDLFFAHGSQGRFTIASSLYGPLVAWIGPSAAHGVALALGQAAWLAGAWVLASALLPDRRARLVALAGLILLPGAYSHPPLLRYGEAVATPRLFAEAATLAAIGLVLRGRWLAAVALVAGGAALHPLQAAPGAAVLVLLRALAWPRLAGALVGAGVLAALLLPLLPDGAGPLLRMDAAWRAVVASIVPFTLPDEWTGLGLLALGTQVALAVLALEGTARRLVLAALLAAGLGLLLAAIGGEVAGLQLVLAAQPWRALWLLLCVVNLLLPGVLLRHAPGAERTTALLLLATLALTPAIPGMMLASPPLAVLALVLALLRRRGIVLPRVAVAGALLLAGGWALAVLLLAGAVALDATPGAPFLAPRMILLGAAGLVLLAAVLRGAAARVVVPAAALLLALAIATHDQRTPWQRFVETPGPEQAALEAFLPPGGVFWDGGIDLVWQRLRRPAQFSCVQGSGVLFFRGTAMGFRNRAETFAFQDREGRCNQALSPADAPPDRAALARACQAEPGLDHIVLGRQAEGLAPDATFALPVGRSAPHMIGESFGPGEVFRYDCAALR